MCGSGVGGYKGITHPCLSAKGCSISGCFMEKSRCCSCNNFRGKFSIKDKRLRSLNSASSQGHIPGCQQEGERSLSAPWDPPGCPGMRLCVPPGHPALFLSARHRFWAFTFPTSLQEIHILRQDIGFTNYPLGKEKIQYL